MGAHQTRVHTATFMYYLLSSEVSVPHPATALPKRVSSQQWLSKIVRCLYWRPWAPLTHTSPQDVVPRRSLSTFFSHEPSYHSHASRRIAKVCCCPLKPSMSPRPARGRHSAATQVALHEMVPQRPSHTSDLALLLPEVLSLCPGADTCEAHASHLTNLCKGRALAA